MAYADLALARHLEAVFGWGDGPVESHLLLGEAARKVVAIDDNDAMAHSALAIFELFSGRHEQGRRRLHRALNVNPNSEVARGYLGVSYAFGGDYEAALPHLEEAMRLSPRGLLPSGISAEAGQHCWQSATNKRLSSRGTPAKQIPNFPTFTRYRLPRMDIWGMLLPLAKHCISY
jgi:tetratricopeptide (TPR) repeat protein